MPRKNLLILVLAIAMGGIAAFLARNWPQAMPATQSASQIHRHHRCCRKATLFGAALTANDLVEVPGQRRRSPEGAFVSKDSLFKDRSTRGAVAARGPRTGLALEDH